MDNNVIQFNSVSKKFCRSLKRSMWYGFQDVLRDTVGIRTKSARLRPKEFWAVDDVSFELKEGECLGLIGRNGAGKSTILKMLNGIILPDKGTIKIRGRVGALIEVGAGFHPQLTGRENIYINGAILGLTKKEIDRHFDSIVAFSGIEEFIDTPVKFYSSGMFVRLGFSVAAHLQPDVLLVDEILAVGDMLFQGKCLEHISHLCREGCTIILVSHDEERVRRVCDRGILLDKGRAIFQGDLNSCYAQYHGLAPDAWIGETRRAGNRKVEIRQVEFLDAQGIPQKTFRVGQPMTVRVHLVPHEPVDDPIVDICFNSNLGYAACSINSKFRGCNLGRLDSPCAVEIRVPSVHVSPGGYRITAIITGPDQLDIYDWRRNSWDITVEHDSYVRGAVWMPAEWRVLPTEEIVR